MEHAQNKGAPEDFHPRNTHSRRSDPTHASVSSDSEDGDTSDRPSLPTKANSLPRSSSTISAAATAAAAAVPAVPAEPAATPKTASHRVRSPQRQGQRGSETQLDSSSCVKGSSCQEASPRQDSSDQNSDISLDDAARVAACLRTDSLELARQRGCRERPSRHHRPRPRPASLELALARLSHHPGWAAGPRAKTANGTTRARRLSLSDVPGPHRHQHHVLKGRGSSSASSILRPGSDCRSKVDGIGHTSWQRGAGVPACKQEQRKRTSRKMLQEQRQQQRQEERSG
ncbi:hypothetical protein DUNSADRAFT_13140 [Dunaliella salina]|uniref:Encoded protein n=1 Tax=Dunaliella salina TaxID=3046 RepID=A0ABQ7G9Z9_DUNSA|nr:hypothetical protein DUNSADRAFT_13140 [Dunaliella salina]|eukprot:KAF5831432.1 hypothetical protein DUNSADRAFT_13140 [Dunaliella salina]